MSLLHEAIRRLTIPTLWQKLGLPGRVREHCCVRSPLRNDDQTPSFSIYASGSRWKDHGTGQGGDSFELFKAIKKLDGKGAYRPFLELAGLNPSADNHSRKF
jgi:hypothetical protein